VLLFIRVARSEVAVVGSEKKRRHFSSATRRPLYTMAFIWNRTARKDAADCDMIIHIGSCTGLRPPALLVGLGNRFRHANSIYTNRVWDTSGLVRPDCRWATPETCAAPGTFAIKYHPKLSQPAVVAIFGVWRPTDLSNSAPPCPDPGGDTPANRRKWILAGLVRLLDALYKHAPPGAQRWVVVVPWPLIRNCPVQREDIAALSKPVEARVEVRVVDTGSALDPVRPVCRQKSGSRSQHNRSKRTRLDHTLLSQSETESDEDLPAIIEPEPVSTV